MLQHHDYSAIIRSLVKRHPNKKELAANASFSYRHLMRFKNGKRKLTMEKFVRLCSELGIDIPGFIIRQVTPDKKLNNNQEQLKRLYTCLINIDLIAIPTLELLRERCRIDNNLPGGIRQFAEDKELWTAVAPRGKELETCLMDAKRKNSLLKRDWVSMILKLKEKNSIIKNYELPHNNDHRAVAEEA